MAGKPNDKMFKTMVRKHGSEKKAREWFSSIGAIGGRNGTTGGFGAMLNCMGDCGFDDELGLEHKVSQCSGKKGGTISRRRKKIKQ